MTKRAAARKAVYDFDTSSTVKSGIFPLTKHADRPDTTEIKDPIVQFSSLAWSQIQALIGHFEADGKEVGWLTPLISEGENLLFVPEIFVPEQTVTSAETDAPDMDIIARECFEKGYPLNALGWFHLHPGKMGVSPSAQDERQVDEYLELCPTILRGIFNNDGDIKLDYYVRNDEMYFANIDYSIKWSDRAEVVETISQAAERVKVHVYNWNIGKNKGVATQQTIYDSYNDPYYYEYEIPHDIVKPSDDDVKIGVTTSGEDLTVEHSEITSMGDYAWVYSGDNPRVGYGIIADFVNDPNHEFDFEVIGEIIQNMIPEKSRIELERLFDESFHLVFDGDELLEIKLLKEVVEDEVDG